MSNLSRCLFALLSVVSACGKTDQPAGSDCTDTAECASGLSCLDIDAVDQAGNCASRAKRCTTSCTKQTDCATLGAEWHCVSGCGSRTFCDNAPQKTTDLPASAACNATDQCHTGLSCLDLGKVNGMSCDPGIKTCSITCATDADCATLGEKFKCFKGCMPDKICGAVQ